MFVTSCHFTIRQISSNFESIRKQTQVLRDNGVKMEVRFLSHFSQACLTQMQSADSAGHIPNHCFVLCNQDTCLFPCGQFAVSGKHLKCQKLQNLELDGVRHGKFEASTVICILAIQASEEPFQNARSFYTQTREKSC